MPPSQLDDYVLTLRGLREKYADKLHIRIGLEAEYFPAYLGWLREEMERLDIEYLILGCHYDTTDEQDARASRFGGSTSTAHGRRYAEQVVEALETGLYRYLAHPDLFLNRVTAFDADAEKACRDICAAAARLDIPFWRSGLPTFDRLGAAHKVSVGYRGTRNLIFEVGNVFIENLHEAVPDDFRPTAETTAGGCGTGCAHGAAAVACH